MSQAHECDRCGVLFKIQRGTVVIGEIAISEGKKDTGGELLKTWSDIDLCRSCSSQLLDFLQSTLDGYRP